MHKEHSRQLAESIGDICLLLSTSPSLLDLNKLFKTDQAKRARRLVHRITTEDERKKLLSASRDRGDEVYQKAMFVVMCSVPSSPAESQR